MKNEKKFHIGSRKKIYREYGKRVLDVIAAYLSLILLYFPMIIISAAIKLSSSGPVIFRQVRVGAGGKSFICYKFRTMRTDAPHDMPTSSFSDAENYVTPIGRFLRRTSLDELPQLFNVLSGDMSIVGPRPLIPKEREVHEKRREGGAYSLRPGITGLAQIRGRDMISDVEKAAYDAEYAAEICFFDDVKIIAGTFRKIVSADGIKEGGAESTERRTLDKTL